MGQKWRNSKEWKQARHSALERDKCCIICGGCKKLEVHHIEDASYHPDKRYKLDNLVTLCMMCHRPMFHILFKGGYRKKTTKKDFRKFKAIAKYYLKR